MKFYAIIVAGGSGSRMKSEVPKQFLLLAGKPVLMHTIEAFYYSDLHPEIIVVMAKNSQSYWETLCNEYEFTIPVKIVTGGEQRFHSVKKGLEIISENSIIAIHDAVRPVLSNELITRCFVEAQTKGAVACGYLSKDSVRQLANGASHALDRENIYLMQTPQVFHSELIKNAYQQHYLPEFTDDASVAERAGNIIHIIEGEPGNIKITFPEDLEIAACLLKKIRH